MKKRFEIVKMLVENGADLNKAKGLPLMNAIENKDLKMINYFLETKLLKLEVIKSGLKKAKDLEDHLPIASLLINDLAERETLEEGLF